MTYETSSASKPVLIAAGVAVASIIGIATLAVAQTPAGEAAEAAEQVAEAAETAIEAIDPTTGGDSLVVDPSLPQPYGPEVGADSAGPFEPGLPPIGEDVPAIADAALAESASQTVSNPVVQELTPVQASREVSEDGPFVIKRILPIEGPIRYGEWYWDDEGVPDGPLVMTVDLEARVLSVFRGGYEIGATAALLGTTSHPTPLGTFPILTKEIDNVSEKYNNAPMPYTLRLTWDGIAIHGSPVINGYASHGCIGVPDEFAAKLFEIAERGDKVVITRGRMIGLGDAII
ncbi:MAG: L,D-transpeptidase family protein [Erythrobacter sp.]|uniref:L,D-transpeptidase family protein n=1 Tax=Marinobacter alexandrii TaxID=2570351 RepID=UPI003298986F